jgi:hypothetical protein
MAGRAIVTQVIGVGGDNPMSMMARAVSAGIDAQARMSRFLDQNQCEDVSSHKLSAVALVCSLDGAEQAAALCTRPSPSRKMKN